MMAMVLMVMVVIINHSCHVCRQSYLGHSEHVMQIPASSFLWTAALQMAA
jgi:hypothetical protein